MSETPAPPEDARPDMMRFRRARHTARMPADQARRQGAVVTLALTLLGSRDAALDYLNAYDAALDARPIDLASATDEGFATIKARLEAKA